MLNLKILIYKWSLYVRRVSREFNYSPRVESFVRGMVTTFYSMLLVGGMFYILHLDQQSDTKWNAMLSWNSDCHYTSMENIADPTTKELREIRCLLKEVTDKEEKRSSSIFSSIPHLFPFVMLLIASIALTYNVGMKLSELRRYVTYQIKIKKLNGQEKWELELCNEGMQNEQFYEIWFLDLTFKTTLQNVIFGKKGKLPHKTLVTGKRGVLNCFEPVSYELTSKQIKAFKSNNKHTYIVITNPRGKIFAISRKAKRKGLLL